MQKPRANLWRFGWLWPISVLLVVISLPGHTARGALAPDSARVSPASSVVILSDMESVLIDDSGRFHTRKEVLCKAVDARGVDSLQRRAIRFDAQTDTLIVEAVRARGTDGTWKEADSAALRMELVPEIGNASAYERFRQCEVEFPKLNPGAITHLVYRIEPKRGSRASSESHHGGEVLFGDYLPIVDKQFVINCAANRTISYAMQNGDAKPQISHEDGRAIYSWMFHNCPAIIREPNAVSLANLVPRLAWTTFADWEALGTYAGDLFWDKVDSSVTAADGYLQVTSAELRGTPALMNAALWTVLNVRTIHSPLDATGYSPNTADCVWQNRMGTPIDKAVLLTAFLRMYGFNPMPVLVPFEDVPFARVPVLEQFRHVILAVPNGEDTLWLDPCAESYSPGELPHTCTYGMGCMLVAGAPLIMKVPDTSGKEPTHTEIRASIDTTGGLSGFIECKPQGGSAAEARRIFAAMSTNGRAEYARQVAQQFGSRATGTDFSVSNTSDLVSAVTLSLKFDAPDAARRDSGRIAIEIPRNPFTFAEFSLDTSVGTAYPRELPAYGRMVTECGMTLPLGYRLVSLPAPVIVENPYVHIELGIRLLPHGLEWTKSVEIKADQIPAADYPTVVAAFQALESLKNRQIVIEPIPAPKAKRTGRGVKPRAARDRNGGSTG